ncbi:MAG: 3-isopropylmalate dehydratase small subunit [Actinomycetota bacterium]|nr:3-isopropylmalate dehydratase small subunit [Actinomycetota bacterium]
MQYKGRAWKFGRDIDTDLIIPARYLKTSDPVELGKHCMEDADPEFASKISKGDIIIAEENFGCGSSREHAPIAIKASGISCVIAKSFARIFYRNSINMGLPILESEEAVNGINAGDEVQVDTDKGEIVNLTTGKVYKAKPFPEFITNIIKQGGLINYVKQKVKSQAG